MKNKENNTDFPDFSGKVEQLSDTGEVEKTEYYAKGKLVGTKKGKKIDIPKSVKSATLTFDRPEGKEVVDISQKGATIQKETKMSFPVVEIAGQGYSVAPELQKRLEEQITRRSVNNNEVTKKREELPGGNYRVIDKEGRTQEYTSKGELLYSGEATSAQPFITETALMIAAGGTPAPKIIKTGLGVIGSAIGIKGATSKESTIGQRVVYSIIGTGSAISSISGAKNLFINKEIPKTSFLAFIERTDTGSKVNVIQKSGKQYSVSSENIINIGDRTSIGGGKGYTFDKNKVIEFQTIGGGKEIGTSKKVTDLDILRIEEEYGKGFLSRTFIRDTGKVLEKTKFGFENIKGTTSEFKPQDIITNVQDFEGFSILKGTINPKIRVYKKGGVSYIIRKPEIKGAIIELKDTTNQLGIGVSQISKGVQKVSLLEKQSVISQIKVPKIESPKSSLPIFVKLKEPTKEKVTIKQNQIFEPKINQREITFTKLNQEQLIKEDNKERIIPKIKSVPISIQKENQFVKQISSQSMLELSKQKEEVKIVNLNLLRRFIPNIKKSRTSIEIKQPFKRSDKKEAIKSIKEDSFNIIARRYGKFLSIGTAKTKEESGIILKKYLKTTLGASGKVLKEGKEIQLNDLGLEFTKGKKDPFLVVQKSKYRLGTTPEVKEIQFFKRKKQPKNNWFS